VSCLPRNASWLLIRLIITLDNVDLMLGSHPLIIMKHDFTMKPVNCPSRPNFFLQAKPRGAVLLTMAMRVTMLSERAKSTSRTPISKANHDNSILLIVFNNDTQRQQSSSCIYREHLVFGFFTGPIVQMP
jgi:hypothetical protein